MSTSIPTSSRYSAICLDSDRDDSPSYIIPDGAFSPAITIALVDFLSGSGLNQRHISVLEDLAQVIPNLHNSVPTSTYLDLDVGVSGAAPIRLRNPVVDVRRPAIVQNDCDRESVHGLIVEDEQVAAPSVCLKDANVTVRRPVIVHPDFDNRSIHCIIEDTGDIEPPKPEPHEQACFPFPPTKPAQGSSNFSCCRAETEAFDELVSDSFFTTDRSTPDLVSGLSSKTSSQVYPSELPQIAVDPPTDCCASVEAIGNHLDQISDLVTKRPPFSSVSNLDNKLDLSLREVQRLSEDLVDREISDVINERRYQTRPDRFLFDRSRVKHKECQSSIHSQYSCRNARKKTIRHKEAVNPEPTRSIVISNRDRLFADIGVDSRLPSPCNPAVQKTKWTDKFNLSRKPQHDRIHIS